MRPIRPVLVSLAVLCLTSVVGLSGCAANPAPPPARPKVVAKPPSSAPPSLPAGQLPRTAVDGVVLANGPPWLLSRVPVEEVLRESKFIGWRVLSLPAEWGGIDLKAGDVVTRVNGMTLERPEDLWMAWTSLVVATDLRVAYERDGASRELAFQIIGEPSKEVPATMRSDEPPPPPPKGAPKKQTIVIVGDEAPAGDPTD